MEVPAAPRFTVTSSSASWEMVAVKVKDVPAFSANFSVYSQQLPNNNEPFLKYSQSICEPNSNANFFNLNWIL